MFLNGKVHREALYNGSVFLAGELQKYARICGFYLGKATTFREEFKAGIIVAYTALLRYAAELKKLGNKGLLGESLYLSSSN
jgi:hypothetical protein